MKYYYLTSTNEEQGPISEDNLILLAQKKKISPDTQIRNAMVKNYKNAGKVPCLSHIFESEDFTDNKASATKNLHRSASSIRPPAFNYRFMAFFLDALVISALITLSFNLVKILAPSVDQSHFGPMFMGSCAAIPVLYYGLTLGYKAQTFGYWFFGIMVIRGEGEPVLVCRAAFSALFFMLTFPLAPVLIYIFNKGLHESLAGIRVVNVKLG
jgi:uncharacterized RDD family membrane protein YckC